MLKLTFGLEQPIALGIGAASFCSAAEKDIAESPTATPERPKEKDYESTRPQDYKKIDSWKLDVIVLIATDFCYNYCCCHRSVQRFSLASVASRDVNR